MATSEAQKRATQKFYSITEQIKANMPIGTKELIQSVTFGKMSVSEFARQAIMEKIERMERGE